MYNNINTGATVVIREIKSILAVMQSLAQKQEIPILQDWARKIRDVLLVSIIQQGDVIPYLFVWGFNGSPLHYFISQWNDYNIIVIVAIFFFAYNLIGIFQPLNENCQFNYNDFARIEFSRFVYKIRNISYQMLW